MTDQYRSGKYVESNPTYHVEDSAWKAAQVMKMLRRHGLAPNSVCEVGCGAGEILAELQQSLPAEVRFCGYDISPQAHAFCRARENANLQFRCEDLLHAESEPFDLLLCIDVMEHVEDYLGFLRELRSKGAWKLFHIPLDMWVGSVLFSSPILDVRNRAGHLHYFSKETALLTLQHAGHRIVDWFYTPASVDRGSGLTAKVCNIPRRLFFPLRRDLTVRVFGGYSVLVLTR